MASEEMDLAKEAVKEGVKQMFAPVQDVLQRLAGPAATEIGLGLGDTFRVWRFKRMVKLLADLRKVAEEARLDIRQIAHVYSYHF